MFERAAGYLGKEATVDAHATPDAAEKHTKAGTKRICAELTAGRETAVIYTGEMLQKLHDLCDGQLQQTVTKSNRVMYAVLNSVWQACPWLWHYYQSGAFVGMLYPSFSDFPTYLALWKQIIGKMADAVHRLMPVDAESQLGRICVYILEHPEEDIRLQTIAGIFYVNRSYLSGLFHQKAGITFNAYLQRVRITHARFLMESEHLPMEKLCAKLGYRDVNYFSRQFRIFNSTPPCGPVGQTPLTDTRRLINGQNG